MSFKDDLLRRANEYTQHYQLVLGRELGCGVHGIVLATKSQPLAGQSALRSAIKVHQREPDYARERDIYLRLKTKAITTIQRCHVPQLLRFDDAWRVIEMTVVKRPFVLDFAGAFLDRPPDFSAEVLAEWQADKLEQFGSRWPEVQAILAFLERLGIFMIDVSPNNVSLPKR